MKDYACRLRQLRSDIETGDADKWDTCTLNELDQAADYISDLEKEHQLLLNCVRTYAHGKSGLGREPAIGCLTEIGACIIAPALEERVNITGISLLDYFAGQAMSGLIAGMHGHQMAQVANQCYSMASAMIEERRKWYNE